MPSLPSPGAIIKSGFKMGVGIDVKALCQLYLAFSGTSTTALLETLASNLANSWDSHLASLAAEQVVLEDVTCTDLTSSTSPEGYQAVDYAGTRSGGMTAGVCTVISGEISRRYRGGHPRNYWPFGGTGDLADAQSWSDDYLDACETAWQAFLTATPGCFPSGITYVGFRNVSYFEGFTNHTYPSGRVRSIPTVRGTPVVDAIGSYVIRPYIGSQRRRILVRSQDS